MPTITAIRAKGRKTDRFVVELDEESFATVGLEILERFSLHKGDVLDEAQRAALAEAASTLSATDRAMRMLAAGGRARGELKRKLIQKGEAPAQAARAVEKLAAQGLLDDAVTARQHVRARAGSQGRRRLAFDLSRKGISKDVAAAAIEEVLADPASDVKESLDRLVAKKLRALAKYDPALQKRRLLGFLARRGYGAVEIRAAMAGAGFGGRS